MGEKHHDRDTSDLDYGIRPIFEKMATILQAERKTLNVGVIGLRTDKTDLKALKTLTDTEGYEHNTIHRLLRANEQFRLPEFQVLREKCTKISKTDEGDTMGAILIAYQMIREATFNAASKKLKFDREIVLVTNGTGLVDTDNKEDIDQLIGFINDAEIRMVVLGVDFDDAEYGFKEEDKDMAKAQNEEKLRKFVERCDNGAFATMDQVINEAKAPEVKATRPYASYKGTLTLGDPAKYESALVIDIERYFKTKQAKPPTASAYVTSEAQGEVGEEDINMEDVNVTSTGEALDHVRNARVYQVEDPSAPGGKRDISRDDLAMGYEYGRTAVAIAESDYNVTKLETTQSMTILGFLPQENYPNFYNMGESCISVAPRTNAKAALAMSCFARTLTQEGAYAVARLVAKDGKDPQLVLLSPYVHADVEGLIDVPLPFAEDYRLYQFPPLDRVISTSGSVIHKHRYLPTDPLKKAMSDYVDAMDLSSADQDEDGNQTEWMKIEDVLNPVIHRIQAAIRYRVMYPDADIQPPAEILMKYSQPPSDLLNKPTTKKHISHLIRTADIKRVPPRSKARRTKDVIKPLSGLDVDALLKTEHRTEIRPENAIPEFRQALGIADSEEKIQEATSQMGAIVKTLVEGSVGDSGYQRAIADLETMREELVDLEMPNIYNDFMRGFKDDILAGKLGGNRREFWFEIRKSGLGLVTKDQSEVSDVPEEEAKEFLKVKQ